MKTAYVKPENIIRGESVRANTKNVEMVMAILLNKNKLKKELLCVKRGRKFYLCDGAIRLEAVLFINKHKLNKRMKRVKVAYYEQID